jgi:hypothetical protein
MEPEISLLRSQKPAIGPYLEPVQSSSQTVYYLPVIHFNIVLPFTPRPSRWPLPSGFPTKS